MATITPRQLSYIEDLTFKLVDWDRVPNGLMLKDGLVKTLAISQDPEEPSLTKSQASAIIDWLTAKPMLRREARPAGNVWTRLHSLLEKVPEGRYAMHHEEDAYDFFAVDLRRKRVSRILGGNIVGGIRRVRIPVSEQCQVLERIVAFGDFDMLRQNFGRELGQCGCCGKGLTDPISISRGIGPDCWVRKGFAS